MKRYILIPVVFALMATAFTADASAQSREGFFLGLDLGGLSVTAEDDEEAGSGFGGGFDIGYGFTERFALVLGANGASVDNEFTDDETATAAAGYLAGRINFGKREGALNGFVQIGGGAASYEAEVEDASVSIDGTGGLFGVGATYFVSPNFMLMGTANYYAVQFNSVSVGGISVDVDFDANYAFIGVGVRYMIR